VGAEVLRSLEALGIDTRPRVSPTSGNKVIPLDPEAVKLSLDRLVMQSGMQLLRHTAVTDAGSDGGIMAEVECEEPGGRFQIRARAFIDVTGHAALAAYSGGSVRVGSNAAKLQAGTLMIRLAGIPLNADLSSREVADAVALYRRSARYPLACAKLITIRLPGKHEVLLVAADAEVDGLSAEPDSGRGQRA
jgi:hypothetical protein